MPGAPDTQPSLEERLEPHLPKFLAALDERQEPRPRRTAQQQGAPAHVQSRCSVNCMTSVLPAANALVGRLADPSRRGLVYGMTSSAYFLGNTLGPLCGGAVAATVGIQWVFAMTGSLIVLNLLWVWRKVPEVNA